MGLLEGKFSFNEFTRREVPAGEMFDAETLGDSVSVHGLFDTVHRLFDILN